MGGMTSFSYAMNYIAEEEKLIETVHSGKSDFSHFGHAFGWIDQLPKILHKTEGSFSLAEIVALSVHNQDTEIKVDILLEYWLIYS
jgi:hypothetical protein